jgi:hypothetical protein
MSPGCAKRMLKLPIIPAMFGFMPSQTILPSSSSLKPLFSMCFWKRPDCELPKPMTVRMLVPSGLLVPTLSFVLAAEERDHVAHRGVAHTEHERVLRGTHELVQQRGIEAALDAQARRVGRAGKRHRAAVGVREVGARDRDHTVLTPLWRLLGRGDELRVRGVHARRGRGLVR